MLLGVIGHFVDAGEHLVEQREHFLEGGGRLAHRLFVGFVINRLEVFGLLEAGACRVGLGQAGVQGAAQLLEVFAGTLQIATAFDDGAQRAEVAHGCELVGGGVDHLVELLVEALDHFVLLGVIVAQRLAVLLGQQRQHGAFHIDDPGLQKADEGCALLGLLRTGGQQRGAKPQQGQQAQQARLVNKMHVSSR